MNIESAAHSYASIGWPVIPLHWINDRGTCSCRDKSECDKPAKHPLITAWPDRASIDHEIISAWWAKYPRANVGLVTGHSFDVLDIDGAQGNQALINLAIANRAIFPDCWKDGPMSITRKGHHLWYQPTGVNRLAILPKVDWKGVGGFVVAPPSVHQSGHVYRWADNHGPDIPIEPAPEFLIGTLAESAPASNPSHITPYNPSTFDDFNPSGLLRVIAEAPLGARNNRLNWAAHKLGQEYRRERITTTDAVSISEQFVQTAITIGLPENSSRRTVVSGFKKGSGQNVG